VAINKLNILHIIADYTPGDLAVAEIISAIAHDLPEQWQWHFTSTQSFDTLGTGFCVGQIALHEEPLRAQKTMIYANCAPRLDQGVEKRKDNEGEGLFLGVLKNGIRIVAVNSRYSLSFIRDELAELWRVEVPRSGSQFRSRDSFPPIVGQVARGDLSFPRTRLSNPMEVIPEAPKGVIAYRDSFGNMKTTYRSGDKELAELKEGQEIYLEIGNKQHPAIVATGSFHVRQGYIAFAPGSSGHRNRFWEIFKRGDSAWKAFGQPNTGVPVKMFRI